MSEPRVAVVGAGPAGMRAALALLAHGIRPTVIDEGARAGGQIYRRPPAELETRPPAALYGTEAGKAASLHAAFDEAAPRMDYRPRSLAWALEGGILHVERDGVLERLPHDALLLATGASDLVLPMEGWTLPGTFTLGGAQVVLKSQGCAVGRRTVFLGASPLLPLVATQYAEAGAEVAAVLETTPFGAKVRALPALLAEAQILGKGLALMARLAARRIPVAYGVRPLAVEAGPDGAVAAIRYRARDGRERRIACDAVAYGYGLKPEAQLADLAGVDFAFDGSLRQWFPRIDPDGRAEGRRLLYLAGDGAATGGADAAEASGELAALALLADTGAATPDPARMVALRRRVARLRRFQREGIGRAFRVPEPGPVPDDLVVCRCEAITAGEIRAAARGFGRSPYGAHEINRAKAFSRLGMGRCQGRMCGLGGAAVLADALGTDLAAAGRLRGQAPVKPLPLDARPAEAADAP